MKRVLLPFLLLLALAVTLNAQSVSAPNYTAAEANSSISAAYSYVNTINQSGYLIFQPNLTQAYAYLSKASEIYNASPNAAVFDAQKAQQIAEAQYGSLNYFRYKALPWAVLCTAVVVLVLLKVMEPIKGSGGKRGLIGR